MEADEASGWMWYEPSYGCIGREKQRAYTAHTYENKDSYSPCILLQSVLAPLSSCPRPVPISSPAHSL